MSKEDRGDSAAGDQPPLNRLIAAVWAPALALSAADGQVRPVGVHGVYVEDVRILSQLTATFDGREPTPLGLEVAGGPTNAFDAAAFNVGTARPDPTIFLARRRTVTADGMSESFTLSSRDRETTRFSFELVAACDFATIAAVKSGRRPAARTPERHEQGLTWREGSSVIDLSCSSAPDAIDAEQGVLRWQVSLPAGGSTTITVTATLHERDHGPVRSAGMGEGSAVLPVPRVEAADIRLEHFVRSSLADLNGLRLVADGHPDEVFLAAGVPWFLTLFGRDSIWAARMLLPLGTNLALGTLRALARRQGRSSDAATGEQPGKILHELRRERNEHGLWPHHDADGARPLALPPVYYGTVDATPLWVCLLRDAWRWGLPDEDVEQLLGTVEGCLRWLTEHGCRSDGFVSYLDESGSGLTNQGWKDSHDAIQFRDGTIASAPIALCEVQAYAYEAAIAGAELFDAFGRSGSDRWRGFAADLADRFRDRFWVEDANGPYPAVALDRDGTAVDALSSNIGHLLGTGLLSDAEAEQVALRLGRPELGSGFGLRTLAASMTGFNPLSYHCGSVWAHDTAIALAGLSRTPGDAARRASASLVDGLLAAAEGFDYRMPELHGGHERAGRSAPLAYPASCRPQAWSAAASVAILAALLGIVPDVPAGRMALNPAHQATGLRLVDGLVLGGQRFGVRIEPDGSAFATGAAAALVVG